MKIAIPLSAAPNYKLDPSGKYLEPRPLRVVVVDDERDTVVTLAALISDEGHDVVGAHSGNEALAVVADFDPDVVLVDIAMPQMSGYEVAKEIRQRYGQIRPMLIAISGRYKQASDRLLAEIVGFDHYVAKPYDPNALLRLLKY